MSPFRSKAQMKAAFSGGLGKEMKNKAKQWAAETPNQKSLPEKKPKKKIASYQSSNGGVYVKG